MGIEWLALFVPVVLSLLAYFIFTKKLVWWEVVLPIVASIIVIMICKWSMVKNLVADTEYYSAHVTEAMHYDQWNEYIKKTCSYTTSHGSGKHRYTRTHYYDCSYVRNHPENWQAKLNTGQILDISELKYKTLRTNWKNEVFVEMNRRYHTIDGDAHRTRWNKEFQTLSLYDDSGSYDNKVQTAETVFHFKELDSAQKKKVYEYPEVIDGKQKACLPCGEYDNLTLRRINGLYGMSKQIKVFVLVFKNQPESVAELQKQYWKNGNKNELVICVDDKSRWCKAFSWSDDKRLEVFAQQIFMNDKLTMTQKLKQLNKMIPKYWKRKHFEDFDYIDVQLTSNQLIWVFVLTTIISIVLLWFGVANDVDDEDTFTNASTKYGRQTKFSNRY